MYLKLEQCAFMKLSADSELIFCNVTCSEEEALGGSRATVLLELVLTSRTSTALACSSFASVRVAVISCCTGFSVLEVSSVAS